jgi:hypothetical protein
MEVTVPLDTALRELHAELSAVGQAGDGETKRLGEVVTGWLKKRSCLLRLRKKISSASFLGLLDFCIQLRSLALKNGRLSC